MFTYKDKDILIKMKKIPISIFLLYGLMTFNSFAVNNYTTIESGVKIYSEYYHNDKSKFKGTVIFENGSGMSLDQWTSNKRFLSCIQKHTSAFFYDRNGLGNSPADLKTSVSNPINGPISINFHLKATAA